MSDKINQGLKPYLSPLHVWALSFGCAVGWGAFIMPGTTFLPVGGPMGVLLGMTLGGALMLLIGYNYHYMMNCFPNCGGSYAYAKKILSYDHGFLAAWFLLLVYLAITWANATALPLIFRHLMGDLFQFGFHYNVAGYEVYAGEIILSVAVLSLLISLCLKGGKLVAWAQTLFAFLLLSGILVGFGTAYTHMGPDIFWQMPYYPPGKEILPAVLGIMVLAPWAFAGFESISHGAEEFRFSTKKAFLIMAAAVITATMAYVFLALMSIAVLPPGYADWTAYLGNLEHFSGIMAVPVFHAIEEMLGRPGLFLLEITLLGGVFTGILGNILAASRMIYAMARDGMLSDWFSRVSRNGVPYHAVLFLFLASLPIPFCGRAAVSWIVDVNTIGVCIAYGYTSFVTLKRAHADGRIFPKITGSIGCAASIFFFLYFMLPTFNDGVAVLSTESYMIFIIWSLLGIIFFRSIFVRGRSRRFGKSVAVWIALLFLVFFTSVLWLREATGEVTKTVLTNLSHHYVAELRRHGQNMNETEMADSEYFLKRQMNIVGSSLTGHHALQMSLILLMLIIMFNLYQVMMEREKQMEVEKSAAEKSNAAKSRFFFNMSHDIRTPMNAILGYVELTRQARRQCDACEQGCETCPHGVRDQTDDYMKKIDAAGQHLLSLINDILEMSRIESGKMELALVPTDLTETMQELHDLFATQMESKNLTYRVDFSQVEDKVVLCDKPRLNRVLLNLVSNAYKFTSEGDSITVTLRQTDKRTDVEGEGTVIGRYELSVKDTGMGMTPDFASKVFEAYERDRTATNIQGTGLGMAITKNIVELMGGTIEVRTDMGRGTEFLIKTSFEIEQDTAPSDTLHHDEVQPVDITGLKVLLVEDIEVNREIATMLLSSFGMTVETAENGKIAVDKVAASKHGDYDLVLMDVQMPVMGGYEATRAIRALPDAYQKSIPIIAMTANAFAEDVQNALDSGMNGHIAKPLDVTKMVETITKVLAEVKGVNHA